MICLKVTYLNKSVLDKIYLSLRDLLIDLNIRK